MPWIDPPRPEPLNIAKVRQLTNKLEVAIENELRRILGIIGLNITPTITQEQLKAQMKIMGVEIFHATFTKSPKFNGWHIYQNKELLLIVCDPKVVGNRIVIERILPNDI